MTYLTVIITTKTNNFGHFDLNLEKWISIKQAMYSIYMEKRRLQPQLHSLRNYNPRSFQDELISSSVDRCCGKSGR